MDRAVRTPRTSGHRTPVTGSNWLLSLQPNANAAVAGVSWFEEHDAGLIECLLDIGKRAGTRIRSPTLKVFDRDL